MITNQPLHRREVVKCLLAETKDLLVVSGLGSATYDCAAAGDNEKNFYLWGAMGGSVPLALGLAIAQPNKPVLVITGDGDLLMGLGALTTVGAQAPKNLAIVVLDNEIYGETGAQPTATAKGTDLNAIARACSLKVIDDVFNLGKVKELSQTLYLGKGPIFANIKVEQETPPKILPSTDGVFLKNRFRDAVLS
ncbi:MAG: thiamine pyrophosphate-dependent enzyme [Alphaproteobacteria bacterium]|nr:thiamine pyrophosphate-dependent enzyme [Alphaproteobacteria bacterium]